MERWRAQRAFRSRDPFWRNRRSFAAVLAAAAALGIALMTASSAAPTGEASSWSFDEGSGSTAASNVTSTYDLTLTNAATFVTPGINGGSALDLRGQIAEQATTADGSGNLGPGANDGVTISLWTRLGAQPGPGTMHVLAEWIDSAGDGWRLYYNGALFFDKTANGPMETVSGTLPADGSWHHVIGRIDGSTQSVWIDGMQQGVSTSAGLYPTVRSGTLYVGYSPNATGDFEGDIDQLAIYDRALTSTEVLDLYNNPINNPTAVPVVNSTADTGDGNIGDGLCNTGDTNSEGATECTLRAAIQEANADGDATTITFQIPTSDPNHNSDVWTIRPVTQLPDIVTPTAIDGSTQAGLTTGPPIQIDGSASADPDSLVFEVGSDGSTVRRLTVIGATGTGIEVNAWNFALEQSHIGINSLGANEANAVGIDLLAGADNALIGGSIANGNVISSNSATGVLVSGPTAAEISYNAIGTTPSGLSARPNGAGIDVPFGTGLLVNNNRISGNNTVGLRLLADNATVTNNEFGVAADGSALSNGNFNIDLGTSADSVNIGAVGSGNTIGAATVAGIRSLADSPTIAGNQIGTLAAPNATGIIFPETTQVGTAVVDRNTITSNTGAGVVVEEVGMYVQLLANRIYDNGGLGIDLGGDGVTLNDVGDADSGPNDLLNTPVITGIVEQSPGVYDLTLSADAPAGNYRVELFASSAPDASGYGEGESFRHATSLAIAAPPATFAMNNVSASPGDYLAAVLIDASTGATSEFGLAVPVTSEPVVNSTGDTADAYVGDGLCDTGGDNSAGATECTLRAAIQEANANTDLTTIAFAIPTSDANHSAGVFTITPGSPLPDITAPLTIDGSTQAGTTTAPPVAIDGQVLSTALLTFAVGSDASTVRELSLLGNGSYGTSRPTAFDGLVIHSDDFVLESSRVGIGSTGTAAGFHSGVAILAGADNATIGGLASAGNTIAANDVAISASGAGTAISSNIIGANPAGLTAVPNGTAVISYTSAPGLVIRENRVAGNAVRGLLLGSNGTSVVDNVFGLAANGGTLGNGLYNVVVNGLDAQIGTSAEGNVIAGATIAGIDIFGVATIEGNTIGTATAPNAIGIQIRETTRTDEILVRDNFISNNTGVGVEVLDVGAPVRITNNQFYANGGLAIDLAGDGVTANDLGDADIGPNSLLNAPVITSITEQGLGVYDVIAQLDVPPGTYDVELYRSSTADPSGFGEGQELRTTATSMTITTSPHGITFTNEAASPNDVFSAIAIETTTGETSEFGNAMMVGGDPIVNSSGNTGDNNPGDGVCNTGGTNSEGATECTLRAAIEEANANPDFTQIRFNIPVSDSGHASDVWQLTSPSPDFPAITAPVEIDASTQPSAASGPPIQIYETVGSVDDILVFAAGSDGSTLRGISLFAAEGSAVIVSSPNFTLESSYIGRPSRGTVFIGNVIGVELLAGADNATIGGSPAVGNVISSNSTAAISTSGAVTGTVVSGNWIGTTVDGVSSAPNGIGINHTLGSGLLAEDNLIAGNTTAIVVASDGATVRGNTIGQSTATNGTGIRLDETVGVSTHLINGNTISNNTGNAIEVVGLQSAAHITNNQIFDNGGLGIDLGADGVTLNDPDDSDVGANGLLNHPTITDVTENSPGLYDVTVEFVVPTGVYSTELFTSPTADPSGFGEGAQRVATASTSADGTLQTLVFTAVSASPGDVLTATNINTAAGTTSEFGNAFTINPPNSVTPIGDRNHDENDAINLPIGGTAGGSAPLSWSALNLPDGLSIDSGSGVISGTLTYDSAGVYNVTITASSADAPDGTADFAWTVNDVNRPPTISGPTNVLDSEGATVSVQVNASDPDLDTITYNAFNLPPGLTISTTTGEITGTLPFTAEGTYNSTINVNDGEFTTAGVLRWTISNTNRPPTITAPADQTTDEGASVSLPVSAVDPDSDPMTWSALDLPSGLSISTTTGEITGTPDFASAGTYTVTVTASDGNVADIVNFTWTITDINRPPILAVAADRTDAENDTIVADFPATDLDGNTLTWWATVLPPGLSIDSNTGQVTGTLTYDAAGNYPVQIVVSDGSENAMVAFTWTVTNTNRPPLLSDPGTWPMADGDNVSIVPTAADPDGDPLSWSAQGLPPGLSIDPTTGEITGATDYDSPGTFTITVTASDGSSDDTQTFEWTVTNLTPVIDAIADQTNAEGDAVSLTVVATDAEGDAISWAATGLPAGLSIDPSTGAISGSLSYESSGTYTVELQAGDAFTSATTTFDWTVANTNRPPILAEIPLTAHTENDTVSIELEATDLDGDATSFAAIGLPPGLTIDPATGTISGSLDFDSAGTYTVSLSVTDGELVDSETVTWIVFDQNRPPIISAPSNTGSTAGDAVSVRPFASDPDGDSLTFSAIDLPPGLTIDSTTGRVSGILTVPGDYTITIRASDGSDSAQIAVPWSVAPPPTTTTTTTTTIAPSTTTTAAPTTTTVPPTTTSIPEPLAFVALEAVDDSVSVTDARTEVDVLENDVFEGFVSITELTQPSFGMVEVGPDGTVIVDLPRSFAGNVAFTYTARDERGVESTARVEVFSVNVLAPAGELVDPKAEPIESVEGVLTRVETLFGGLIEVELSTLQVAALGFAPLVLGILYLILRRRDELVSVTGVPVWSTIAAKGTDDTAVLLRHDQLGWATARTRLSHGTSEVLVDVPGKDPVWVPANHLTDTGY